MFRVGRQGEGLDDADTIDGAREIVRREPPGRNDTREFRAQPFPSGHTKPVARLADTAATGRVVQ